MSFKIMLARKDRAASRFLAQVHAALSNAFVATKKERKITQRAICETLGVDKAVISRILSGGGNPTARTIAELADALGYRPELVLHRIEVGAENNHVGWKQELEQSENSVGVYMVKPNASIIAQNTIHFSGRVRAVGASQ